MYKTSKCSHKAPLYCSETLAMKPFAIRLGIVLLPLLQQKAFYVSRIHNGYVGKKARLTFFSDAEFIQNVTTACPAYLRPTLQLHRFLQGWQGRKQRNLMSEWCWACGNPKESNWHFITKLDVCGAVAKSDLVLVKTEVQLIFQTCPIVIGSVSFV